MKALGISLVIVGFVLLVRGITYTAPTKSWIQSQLDAARASWRAAKAWIHRRRQELRDWRKRMTNRVWNGWQLVLHKLTGRPRRYTESLSASVTVSSAVNAVLTKAPPTAESNLAKLEALEKQIADGAEETLRADAYAVVGALLTVIGSIILVTV